MPIAREEPAVDELRIAVTLPAPPAALERLAEAADQLWDRWEFDHDPDTPGWLFLVRLPDEAEPEPADDVLEDSAEEPEPDAGEEPSDPEEDDPVDPPDPPSSTGVGVSRTEFPCGEPGCTFVGTNRMSLGQHRRHNHR